MGIYSHAAISFCLCLSQNILQFLDIPLEIYKVWNYSEDRTLHGYNKINESDLMVVEVELTRNPETDSETVRISAQAVETMIFGEWFQIFVQDYNKNFRPST